jgi:hypothetical protein
MRKSHGSLVVVTPGKMLTFALSDVEKERLKERLDLLENDRGLYGKGMDDKGRRII